MRHLAMWGIVVGLCACGSRATIGSSDEAARARGVPHLPIAEDTRVVFGAMSRDASASLRQKYTKQEQLIPPPVSLVPTDGSELALEALVAKVDIDGPLARTELHFTFRNTEARQREGRFALTLPPTASIARFAMKIGEQWREARVVSRQKGREVYEAILKQKRDPALLERDLGNQFSARVFPIAPNEHKEIVLAYEHAVGAAQPYVLALRGLPQLPTLTVDIDRDGKRTTDVQSGRMPEDVVVPIARGSTAVATGDTFVARVELPSKAQRAALGHVLILVDTSASRATVMGRQATAVRAILANLPTAADVAIAAYDHGVTQVYRGTPAQGIDVVGTLFDVGALGASDLGNALAYAANSGMDRVILVGDGMATLGEHEPAKLAALVKGKITRIDALQVGATIDRDTLGPIVAAGTTPGAILDGRDLTRATAQLAEAILPERRIAVVGATTWPATTRGVAPGDPVWVFGRRKGQGPLRIEVGNQTTTIAPQKAHQETIVRRAVAGAQVAAMTEQLARLTDGAQRLNLASELEKLALENSLVSMQTSLIVLESDADEQRFLGAPPVDTASRVPVPARTFESTLGAASGSQSDTVGVDFKGGGGNEVIEIRDRAPMIDVTSTSQGVTITQEYIRTIPVPGRTFEGTVSGEAITISGSSSLENNYVVDGVGRGPQRSGFRVNADVMSPLANDMVAESIRRGAMFTQPEYDGSDDDESASPSPSYDPPAVDPWKAFAAPHEGTYLAVRQAIANDQRDKALALAAPAELDNPGDVTNVIALGEALEARGAYGLAARAYGSLIDLYPNRVELLRAAGQRLDALAQKLPAARDIAIDAYRRALAERPDHPQTYRLLALSLLLANRPEADNEALSVLQTGVTKATDYAVQQVLTDDRAIAEAVIAARHPERAKELLGATPVELSRAPSLRIILAWETDANDVDLHVRDRSGEEAFFSSPTLSSGGKLLQDITRGYGPEMFTIMEPKAFPYRIGVHYYSRGPMGIGLGTVQAIRHDGKGHITVQQAPFVIQTDHAMVELPAISH